MYVKLSKTTQYEPAERKKTTAPTDSRIITDYSTKGALPSLTLEIERDPVRSGRDGRSCEKTESSVFKHNL